MGTNIVKKNDSALKLQPSLLDEALKVAKSEGVPLNQLVNVAVAEKLSALRTETYFRERAARANLPAALALLEKAGQDNRPQAGDELPAARPEPGFAP